MDENPFQAPTTGGVEPSAQERAFKRTFIGALGVNLATAMFASLILDGGWIAKHYLPFAIGLLATTIMLYVRRRGAGYLWSEGDRMFLYAAPPVCFLIAMIVASLR